MITRFRAEELLSENQLLNTIYTRITESDLIPAEQRYEILKRVTPTLSAYEAEPTGDSEVDQTSVTSDNKANNITLIGLFALATSTIGGMISILPTIKTLPLGKINGKFLGEVFPMLAGTISVSFAIISLAYAFGRLRSSQEQLTSKRSEISEFARFEMNLRSLIKSFGAKIIKVRHQREVSTSLLNTAEERLPSRSRIAQELFQAHIYHQL